MKQSYSQILYSVVVGLLLNLSGCAVSAQESAPLPDIHEFVQQTYIHGVPYDLAYRYDRRVVPELVKMLQDSGASQYWPNIVVTLGMIGEESTVKPLIDFLLQGRGEASQEYYAARSSVLIALGYLANRSGSDAALSFLKESVDPSVWKDRKLRWTSPFHDEEGRDEQLSTLAILGLALSGQESARETLMELKSPPPSKSTDRFSQIAADIASSAIEEYKYISERGMLDYATRDRAPGPEPIGLITGSEEPPKIITGSSKVPSLARPSMATPELPPPPEMLDALSIPEAELQDPPEIDEGNQ